MARKKSILGQGLSRVVAATPSELMCALLSTVKTPEDDLIHPPDVSECLDSDQAMTRLISFLESRDRDVLRELEIICVSILELAEGKGETSLKTVAAKRLLNVEYEEFEHQPDALCRSIWIYIRLRSVFHDAESFHAVRRYRDVRSMYAQFEIDLEGILDLKVDQIDTASLCRRLEAKLELRAKSSASILELPKTEHYPRSIMVALRHPGTLSSIQDHRNDGGWRTYYFRPSEEVVLVYTPKLRLIEVCSESYSVRDVVANLFAGTVLKQDLSKKPLARRFFNLERFRHSFGLDLPDFDDVEIDWAAVVEAEMLLGNWSRKLNVKVTKDQVIEQVFRQYLRSSSQLVRSFGLSRVAIAVGYTWRSNGKSGTLRLSISGGNSSNVQSQRDPALRDLGFRLLSHWRLMDELATLTEEEKAKWFALLLKLYDLPGSEVSGAFIVAEGADPATLLKAGYIEKKRRQSLVLVDDGDSVSEAELKTGQEAGMAILQGGFGEDQGPVPDKDAVVYRIDRTWLAETVLKTVQKFVPAGKIKLESDDFASIGYIEIKGKSVPTYLACNLCDPKVIDRLDIELRQRQGGEPGLVFSAGQASPRYLGSNVVVPLIDVVGVEDGVLLLDQASLAAKFDASRTLVANTQVARVKRHQDQSGTLILPGDDPLPLEGANQLTVFERLCQSARDGTKQLRTKAIMEGMSSDNPRQLFNNKRWEFIYGRYISHGSSNRFWRLGPKAD